METVLDIRIEFVTFLWSEAKKAIFWGVFENFVECTKINIEMANKTCYKIQKFILVCCWI